MNTFSTAVALIWKRNVEQLLGVRVCLYIFSIIFLFYKFLKRFPMKRYSEDWVGFFFFFFLRYAILNFCVCNLRMVQSFFNCLSKQIGCIKKAWTLSHDLLSESIWDIYTPYGPKRSTRLTSTKSPIKPMSENICYCPFM